MKQENNTPKNIDTIESMTAEFSMLEPDFMQVKTYRDNLRTRILDHVKNLQEAFRGNEKSHHLPNGVVVRRASKTINHFDADKMNSTWLRAILSTPAAAAIKVSIDPRQLAHSDEIDALLAEIDYSEETQHSYKVELTSVQNK